MPKKWSKRINKLSQHIRHTGGIIIFIQHDGNEENDHEAYDQRLGNIIITHAKKNQI